MLGKVYLVLDFDSEDQKNAVQEVFKEMSNMRMVSGRQIQQAYPFFKQNRQELAALFDMVKVGGIKSLLSMRGAQLVTKLSRK